MQEIDVTTDEKPETPLGKIEKHTRGAFVLVKSGTATIEVDFKSYHISRNSLLLFLPGSHLIQVERSEDFTVSYVTFTPKVYDEVTTHFEPTFVFFLKEYPVGNIGEEEATFVNHQIQAIRHVMDHCPGDHQMQIVRNLTQNFYLALYDRTKETFSRRTTKNVSSQEGLFMKFLMLVHEYAATERDLPFYADRLCITTRYLSTIVRNQTGRTAKDFIDSHCLQTIKILLRTTDEPLQTIAIKLHFPDQSFFSRYFKKLTGIPPTDFRCSGN